MQFSSVEFYMVADRGVLKIYALGPEATSFQSIEEMRIENAHKRFAEEYTDEAGAFPNGGTAGHGNSVAERQQVAAENEMRSFRRIAAKIVDVLRATPAQWNFAAPEEINGAILDGVPDDLRATLKRNLKKDLVNVPANTLRDHFFRKA